MYVVLLLVKWIYIYFSIRWIDYYSYIIYLPQMQEEEKTAM